MSKSAQPTGETYTDTVTGVDDRPHLRSTDDDPIGGWECTACGLSVTIDPQTGVEYGHSRKPRNGGRCAHRLDDLDPDVTAKGGRQ